MIEPKIVTQMRESLIALLDKDDSPFISTEDCAKWFGVDPRTFRKWMYADKVPFAIGAEGNGRGYGVVNKLALWNWVKGAV